MPTTSNFGWTTPADTDLVKDGAAAIRTLGNGVDASFVDLKGGTTGQVLSKASNTDLDYSWVTPNVGDITEVQAGTGISVASGTGPIPVVTNTVATAYDAKGDLIVGTGADTFAKLTVGTNGHTLVADSSETTGLKWAAPTGGGKVLQVVHGHTTTEVTTTSATYADTGLTATITPTSASSTILIIVQHNGIMNNQSTADKYCTFRLMKSTTELTEYEKLGAYTSSTVRISANTSGLTYLDSPATTSATTYKTQIATNGTNGHLVQYGGSRSSICLMEIGA
jgi:hypothetical protein